MAFTGAKSNTYENTLLNFIFTGGTAPATGAELYIGIFTGDGTLDLSTSDAGDAVNLYEYEPTGTNMLGYQRIQVSTVFGTEASAGSISNDTLIDFGTSTGSVNWGTVSGFFIGSEAVQGNQGLASEILYYGVFDQAKSVTSGDSVRITSGNLTISES